MGMRIGYAGVSSAGQRLDIQMDRLADCDRIFHEKASASSTKCRPEFLKALDFVRDEDVFVVTKLDRLARSVVDLAGIVQRLESKKWLNQLSIFSLPPHACLFELKQRYNVCKV
ncbi:MAG: recombinase family protein [Deltaproteobacteria bacterium]|nr:recombinase family protein [Deltaproteobacteria bacterium]